MVEFELPVWARSESATQINAEPDSKFSNRAFVCVVFDESVYFDNEGYKKSKSRAISLVSDQKYPGSSKLFEVVERNYETGRKELLIVTHAIDDPLIEITYNEWGNRLLGSKFGQQYKVPEEAQKLKGLEHFTLSELPEEINFEQTVAGFIKQAQERNFTRPQLIPIVNIK